MEQSLKPLKFNHLLADNPTNPPKYKVEVTNSQGEKDLLGDPRATRALVTLMNQHAVIGGAAAHWGGPAALAEAMSSLHALMFKKSPWHQSFNFVNDAGHTENGIYALRANYNFDNLDFNQLKGFRSLESKLTGHGEAHLNPEGVLISNGPLGSALPQAQGLAIADKLLGKERATICILSDGGAMEGEAKEALASIPGQASKGHLNPFVLIISDNDTKLSGRIEADSFSMAPSFNGLSSLGWEVTTIEDGHHLENVHLTFESVIANAQKNPNKPQAIILKTIKGYGVQSTMDSASGGHGYPLKPYDPKLTDFIAEIYNGDAPSEFQTWAQDILKSKPASKETPAATIVKEKVQPGFARAAIKAAKKGLPVFSLSADLAGSTGIAAFQKEFPHLHLDMGIAESNMISAAVGLSRAGLIPIVDTFAQFGITKGNLPLIMAQLSQGPIIALFSHTGFQDAADGASHQATTYISAVASIPGVDVICCSCSQEAEAYMDMAITHFVEAREQNKTPRSTVFFLGRENYPAYFKEKQSYDWGRSQVLREGKDATLVATGPMVQEAIAASELLASEGIEVTIVNNPFVNNPDIETLKNCLSQTNGRLITVEDHQVFGGMGSYLIHHLAQNKIDFKSRSLGIPGVFGQSAYKAAHLYDKYNIGPKGIALAVKSIL